jgi:plastocyanin
MEENQQETAQGQKSNLNPLLIVVILIIVAAVGVMLWLGSNKTGTQSATTQVTPTTAAMQQEEPTVTATESATDESAMQPAITVEAGGFYFKPNQIRVKQGEKVKITISNKGGVHDFVIDELNVKTEMIQGGASTTVEFTPTKKGTFEFYCSVGNHRQMGMKGTLIVE